MQQEEGARSVVLVKSSTYCSPVYRAWSQMMLLIAVIILCISANIRVVVLADNNDGSDVLMLGSLDQISTTESSYASANGRPEQKIGSNRLITPSPRRPSIVQVNHSKLNITATSPSLSPSRPPIRKRNEENLTTDCKTKRNEILGRQQQGGPAVASSFTTPSPTNQRLRPNRESLSSSGNLQSVNVTSIAQTYHEDEHVPSCNPRGEYDPIQCYLKMGFCWCVNKFGQAIKNTAVKGKQPECDSRLYENESNLVVAGISIQRIKNFLKPSGLSSAENTTPNGNINFDSESATEFNNDNTDGRQQTGDDSHVRGEPTLPLIPNNCKGSRVNAQERAVRHVNESIWVPDCDNENDHLYALRQCHKLKVCWCVDQISGLPLRTNEPVTSLSTANCTEIKKKVSLSMITNPKSRPNSQPPFYHGSSENCDTEKRVEFVILLNSQFRQQLSDYMKQNPASSWPRGLISINPYAIDESQVSKWKFILMDNDRDEKLGDREWSKFKNNFKLVDQLDDIEHPHKQQKSSYFSLNPLMILRSQRKCWRDFLEFCEDGNLLYDESISLPRWLNCTDMPSKVNLNPHDDFTFSENTYAHSKEAAIIRSKKKNPFIGILKPD